MGDMSVPAFTTYIRELIDGQGLKVGAVLKSAGVALNYLSRFETGARKRLPAEIALSLIVAANGNRKHLDQLLKPKTNEDMGRELARQWLDELKQNGVHLVQDGQRQQAIDMVEALVNDPARLGELIGFGKRLLEEQRVEHESR